MVRAGPGLARRPEGPHLRPDRGHRGRRDHVAARGHRRSRGTGTTATAGSGTPPSRCSRSWPAATPTRPRAWRDWLLRALAGRPDQAQIMYGPRGEHRLTELELDWLPGYEGSRPVRIGNGAHQQFQLDVFGEVLDALHQARVADIADTDGAWGLETALADGGRGPLDGARRRHLGGARRSAALHPLEGHGVGGARPRDPLGHPVRPRRADRPLAARVPRDPRRGARTGGRRPRGVRPGVRLEGARRLVR